MSEIQPQKMPESIPEVPPLDIPEGMDEIQYVAAEVLREAVEGKELQAHAANHLLRKGLQLQFDYFMECSNGRITTRYE